MRVRKDNFPVVVQAYESVTSRPDHFIAEQIVYTQEAIDAFTARYAGKLIKQRPLTSAEVSRQPGEVRHKRRSSLGIIVLLLLILAILIFIGFATGWIQQTFGIELMINGRSLADIGSYI